MNPYTPLYMLSLKSDSLSLPKPHRSFSATLQLLGVQTRVPSKVPPPEEAGVLSSVATEALSVPSSGKLKSKWLKRIFWFG